MAEGIDPKPIKLPRGGPGSHCHFLGEGVRGDSSQNLYDLSSKDGVSTHKAHKPHHDLEFSHTLSGRTMVVVSCKHQGRKDANCPNETLVIMRDVTKQRALIPAAIFNEIRWHESECLLALHSS